MGDTIGSLEVGKQADVVVHDRSGLAWQPHADDVILQLVWGSDGRSVREVYVAGRHVIADAESTQVATAELAEQAQAAGRALLARAGIETTPRWR
jgi:5-methylthioadenosine/S-adenosylhomocysteine deaminase